MRTLPLLTNATATGKGGTVAPEAPFISVQAWLSSAGGSATVLIKGSNDPRAFNDPANAALDTIATFTLSGASDQAGFRDAVPYKHVLAEVTAIAGGAIVNSNLGA